MGKTIFSFFSFSQTPHFFPQQSFACCKITTNFEGAKLCDGRREMRDKLCKEPSQTNHATSRQQTILKALFYLILSYLCLFCIYL